MKGGDRHEEGIQQKQRERQEVLVFLRRKTKGALTELREVLQSLDKLDEMR